MLNVIVCVLIAYVLITPLFYAKAVKFGMKIVGEPAKAVSEPVFHIPTPKKKPKMSPQDDRMAQILANIDNYNGTAEGQVKVEVKHE